MKNLPETDSIKSKDTWYSKNGSHSKIQKINAHRHQDSKTPENSISQSDDNHPQNASENSFQYDLPLL